MYPEMPMDFNNKWNNRVSTMCSHYDCLLRQCSTDYSQGKIRNNVYILYVLMLFQCMSLLDIMVVTPTDMRPVN